MSDDDPWRGWSIRLKELATELHKLGEERTGMTLRERRYKEHLRLALHHAHIAEDAAGFMSDDFEVDRLQPRPDGPPNCRTAMTVRFATDILGWTPRKAAASAAITTAQYMLIRNGTGAPRPETLEKLFAALSREGIDMAQLGRIADSVLVRRRQQAEAEPESLPPAPTGEAVSNEGPPAPPARHLSPRSAVGKRSPIASPKAFSQEAERVVTPAAATSGEEFQTTALITRGRPPAPEPSRGEGVANGQTLSKGTKILRRVSRPPSMEDPDDRPLPRWK
jgi:hypothetical protein